ncbi:MAG: hypothetical protein KDI46_03280 [Alphaproteobacteria bacterium]|nr:hypothetical protein [Alphaproteobacteria bacterium]
MMQLRKCDNFLARLGAVLLGKNLQCLYHAHIGFSGDFLSSLPDDQCINLPPNMYIGGHDFNTADYFTLIAHGRTSPEALGYSSRREHSTVKAEDLLGRIRFVVPAEDPWYRGTIAPQLQKSIDE